MLIGNNVENGLLESFSTQGGRGSSQSIHCRMETILNAEQLLASSLQTLRSCTAETAIKWQKTSPRRKYNQKSMI